ncbi:MAG TPA: methyltransferase domain-containing protein [Dongiaceae bacterium]|nr:methyltransferase domain-containing protein [Dongiaceae bacterium]
MRRGDAGFLVGLGMLFLGVAPTHAAGAGEPDKPAVATPSDDATTHHPFNDAARWSTIFDDPSRDAWQKPDLVVDALRIKPGMMVADLGAGTGYFTGQLSRAVGDRGVVLAIDPEPDMARHLGERARKEGLRNVVPVLALFSDPFLPPGRVDRVLIVDTYHHIDDRQEYFRRLRTALAPGGQVAIVDFHKKPLPVGPPPEHKLERATVLAEMTAAGWRLAREVTDLPYQYFLIFEPGSAGGATS